MKIIDLEVKKADGCLRCLITMDSGEKLESVVPWRNPNGLWASPDEARQPDEICAWLRCFAKAIEDAAKARDAA